MRVYMYDMRCFFDFAFFSFIFKQTQTPACWEMAGFVADASGVFVMPF